MIIRRDTADPAEDQQLVLDAGFDRHFAKPVNVDTLEQLVSAGM